MSFKSTVRIDGMEALLRNIKRMGKDASKRVGRKMVTAAAKVVNKAAKKAARVESKTLKKSIGQKVKVFRNTGTAVAIVGPRTKHARVYNGEKRNPTKYAHLVEKGHGGPGAAPAYPFLEPATLGQIGKIRAAMIRAAQEAIEAEAKRA